MANMVAGRATNVTEEGQLSGQINGVGNLIGDCQRIAAEIEGKLFGPSPAGPKGPEPVRSGISGTTDHCREDLVHLRGLLESIGSRL